MFRICVVTKTGEEDDVKKMIEKHTIVKEKKDWINEYKKTLYEKIKLYELEISKLKENEQNNLNNSLLETFVNNKNILEKTIYFFEHTSEDEFINGMRNDLDISHDLGLNENINVDKNGNITELKIEYKFFKKVLYNNFLNRVFKNKNGQLVNNGKINELSFALNKQDKLNFNLIINSLLSSQSNEDLYPLSVDLKYFLSEKQNLINLYDKNENFSHFSKMLDLLKNEDENYYITILTVDE
mgnify:CR=1 FL=1